jgi:hypothetical protein
MSLGELRCPRCGGEATPSSRGERVCARCAPSGIEGTVIARPAAPLTGARGPRGRDGGTASRFRKRLAGGTSGPPRVRVAVGRGEAPITLPPGKVGGVFRRRAFERDVEKLQSFDWSDEAVVDLARRTLGPRQDLHFAPDIPEELLRAARAAHAEALLADERVLVLYDDSLFRSTDDGFLITARALFWKNLGDDPQCVVWDEVDPAQVTYDEETFAIGMADGDVALTHADTESVAPRLMDLIVCLATLAQDDGEP